MAAKRRSSPFDHPIVLTFLIFAILAFMYFASEVLQPLALALLLSLALSPLAGFFERLRMPRVLAVVMSVVLVLGGIGTLGYVVSQQVFALADLVASPELRANIQRKITFLQPKEPSAFNKLSGVASEVAAQLDQPAVPTDITEARQLGEGEGRAPAPAVATVTESTAPPAIQDVRIVSRPSFTERFRTAVGPWLQFLAVGSVVLILVVFLMINREDLSDRIVRLVGAGRISLTTRTMEELGARISRFLAILVLYNATMGFVLGMGLWLIGVPYAATWGVVGALLRFIPYIGPIAAFLLPGLFAAANFPGWWEAALVIGIFATLETFMSSFIEPIMYGRTTGVSAVSLLVAIMFWTWLWGPLGLLMATPLTVCLAVLGKYVPQLNVFATLLGEEAVLDPDVRFYQRLLALDQDGAVEQIEAALKERTRVQVYDDILIPALARAERDHARGEIDDSEQAFVWRVVGEVIDDLDTAPGIDLDAVKAAPSFDTSTPLPESAVLGVAANDHSDALVLRMLRQLLAQSGCPMEIVTEVKTPLQLSEEVGERSPRVVLLSHLPPVGLVPARYLLKRLRASHGSLPLLVGRWSDWGKATEAADRLQQAGATEVLFGVGDARDRILRLLSTAQPPTPGAAGPAAPKPAAAR